MKGGAALTILLAVVHLGCPCEQVDTVLFCPHIPSYFVPGISHLVMAVRNVGVINSTVFKSENLNSVTRLSINNAGITGITENAFRSLVELSDLSLEGNMLSQVGTNWFSDPAVLGTLNLTGNRIEAVNESTFGGFTNLTQLRLSKNEIKTIHPSSFRSQSRLSELDLSENKLVQVSPQVFTPLGSLRSIRLDGNPWHCSCDSKDFVAFLRELHGRSQLDRPMDVTCEAPPALKGQPVWNVSVCVTSPPSRPMSVTATKIPTTLSTSIVKTATASSLQPETSFQPRLTDVPSTVSSHAGTHFPLIQFSAMLSSSKTSVQTKPADASQTLPGPTASAVTTSPSPPSSKTEISVQSNPTDAPTTVSSHTAMLSSLETSVQSEVNSGELTDAPTTVPEPTVKAVTTSPMQPSSKTETSVQPKSTDAPTTVGTNAASPPLGQHTPVHPNPDNAHVTSSKPSTMSETAFVPSQPSNANIVCTLAAVIAVLSVLLFAVSLLALLHRRKRSNKSVMPGSLKEERRQLEEDPGLSHEQSPGSSERDPEVAWRRSLTGVRAKSANAVILTSPFGLSEKALPLENPGDRKEKLGTESEAEGGIEMDNLVAVNPVKGYDTQEEGVEGGKLDKNPDYVYVNTDTVPYLSIGTVPNKPSPDEESAQHPDQRPQVEKVMGRISTWPPTAPQWQARCKTKEEEEGDCFAVWTQNVAEKLSGEMEKIVNDTKHPTDSDQGETEDETEAHMNLRHSQTIKPNEPSVNEAHSHTDPGAEGQPKEEDVITDPPAVRQTSDEFFKNKETKTSETKRSKMEVGEDLKRAVTSRRGTEKGVARSKGPSAGVSSSPDDETLLSGNAYTFMNLLHEVSQNNGRWTRDRWKQVHANKQRR